MLLEINCSSEGFLSEVLWCEKGGGLSSIMLLLLLGFHLLVFVGLVPRAPIRFFSR